MTDGPPTGVRSSMALLAMIGAAVTVLPGIVVYVVLREVGAGIGLAGVIGLFLMFIGCFAYAGWLFGGGHRG